MYKNLILNISNFDRYTESELDMFTSIARLKKLSKGDHFLKEGQISNEIAYIDQGMLMHYTLHDGEIIPADFAVEHEWTAYLKSFSSREPSDMNIMALEESVLFTFSAQDLKVIFEKYPKFLALKNHQIEKSFFKVTQHAADLAKLSTKQRYYKLMQEKPYLINRVPQYYIASYLGMKPQSLSRIRKEPDDDRS
jgi:CRP/FNR family transcriptional regulator, anaerobic regulatory protein